jgi:hypothetical protein
MTVPEMIAGSTSAVEDAVQEITASERRIAGIAFTTIERRMHTPALEL